MIDKQILQDMGFRLAEGWDHEVWFHDSDFWVHFGIKNDHFESTIDGINSTMKEFFEKFLANFESGIESRWLR